MGINDNVYALLDEALSPLGIPHAAIEIAKPPPLYVVYHKISDNFFKHSDGKPTARRVVMGLSVACKWDLAARKEEACTKIRTALLHSGWRIWDGGSDIPREDGSPYIGTHMEAAIELFGVM